MTVNNDKSHDVQQNIININKTKQKIKNKIRIFILGDDIVKEFLGTKTMHENLSSVNSKIPTASETPDQFT